MKRIHTILAGSFIGLLLYKWWASKNEKTSSSAAALTTTTAAPNVRPAPGEVFKLNAASRISSASAPLSATSLHSQMMAALRQDATTAAKAPAPAPRSGPEQLSGDIMAEPGASYQATVVVHAPASWMANVDKVRRYAEGEGFTNVRVSTSAPAGWLGAHGDYHVSATYTGEPKVFERSHGGGQVQITDAWRV
jgi:hypothetical protein